MEALCLIWCGGFRAHAQARFETGFLLLTSDYHTCDQIDEGAPFAPVGIRNFAIYTDKVTVVQIA